MTSHFFNGLKCSQHPGMHGATCAVDALMEIFHYCILGNDGSITEMISNNALLNALVICSNRRISCGLLCCVREDVWNTLVHMIPGAYAPKGRHDAEILQAFSLLAYNTGTKFSSQYLCDFGCGNCGKLMNMCAMSNSILEYDATTNMRFPGNLSDGLSHIIDTSIQHQLANNLNCSCGGFLTPHVTHFNMSDFLVVNLGLTGQNARNEQKPNLVVPQEMCLKGQQYFLAGAVQMGFTGGHFVAIVNHFGAYVVLDDLDHKAMMYPTFAAAVSRLLSDTRPWKELQPYDAGIHILVYAKCPVVSLGCMPPTQVPQSVSSPQMSSAESSGVSPVPSVESRGVSPMASVEGRGVSPMASVESRGVSPMPSVESRGVSPMASVEGRGVSPMASVESRGVSPMPSVEGRGVSPMPSAESSGVSPMPSAESSGVSPMPSAESSGVSPMPSAESSGVSPMPSAESSGVSPMPSAESSGVSPMPSAESSSYSRVPSEISMRKDFSIDNKAPVTSTPISSSVDVPLLAETPIAFTKVDDVSLVLPKETKEIGTINVCASQIQYMTHHSKLYYSCRDLFVVIGIAERIRKKGYAEILDVLSTNPKMFDEHSSLFISYRGKRWMRQDAVEVFLDDKKSFLSYLTQKAAVLEQITKHKMRCFRKSKVCRVLDNEFDSQPPAKKVCHSAERRDSSSDEGISVTTDSADDSPSVDSLHSGCDDTPTIIEGTVKFFDKQISYVIKSGKVFLPVDKINIFYKHVNNKGYLKLKDNLRTAGMDPESCFIMSERGRHTHVSVMTVLHILQTCRLSDKSDRQQWSLELHLVLERIAVCRTKETSNVCHKPKDLGEFLNDTYGNCPATFAKDLSKFIGRSNDNGFNLVKEDLVTLLTANLSNGRKKIVSETVKSCYKILHPVSAKETIYLADNFKGYRLLNDFRKIVPGVLPSENEEKAARHDYIESFGACLLPSRTRAGVKYVLSNTNTNTNTFFPEFQIQIQIQIQIHRQKSYQIQIQIQIQLIKYKYKYKYTMRPRQNCGHFTDEIKYIVL